MSVQPEFIARRLYELYFLSIVSPFQKCQRKTQTLQLNSLLLGKIFPNKLKMI